ncbi:MAG: CARDB domain-containing protein, partial [Hydrogenophaga sp.]|nr:CARDB domain-containing protein [Hydrogenophaga sp.]
MSYEVSNLGGRTPSDQGSWTDMVFLSKDRFLDTSKDFYVGYTSHAGGLDAGGSYSRTLDVTVPRHLEGPYYVFVLTDPSFRGGGGAFGQVREFGFDQNNHLAAAQPVLVEIPPPADLIVTTTSIPARAEVGDDIEITNTIINDSINTAYGNWTDALYLSSDNKWGLDDILIGRVAHSGDLLGGASYDGTLTAKLPPLRDGHWRLIVRPDIYNEVFEGVIRYTDTGLFLAPGEANNKTASALAIQVEVPVLPVAHSLDVAFDHGGALLYRVDVAQGQTLRISVDSLADHGDTRVYVRHGDVPTAYTFDASYSNPMAPDQDVWIPGTKAGSYYVLVTSGLQTGSTQAVLRADLLPLSITKVTPDHLGVGNDEQRWVTVDISGAQFKAGALVRLSRPGVFEVEPTRWQVIDSTHIRAIFDTRTFPKGLYDVTVINPDGQRITEAQRLLIERGIEADVTIGLGGDQTIEPGSGSVYSVSLQSLTNLDTPYVRFDFGATEMGYNETLLEGLRLPFTVFGTHVAGQPDGATLDAAGNTQAYGETPTSGTTRSDIPWASLDGVVNTNGFNLAPGYAFDVPAGGFAGMSFNIQTYPGFAEWMNYDFPGLRDKLYALRPDWKEEGLLDNGPGDLNKISPGLTKKFLSTDPEEHLTLIEAASLPFRFNVVAA